MRHDNLIKLDDFIEVIENYKSSDNFVDDSFVAEFQEILNKKAFIENGQRVVSLLSVFEEVIVFSLHQQQIVGDWLERLNAVDIDYDGELVSIHGNSHDDHFPEVGFFGKAHSSLMDGSSAESVIKFSCAACRSSFFVSSPHKVVVHNSVPVAHHFLGDMQNVQGVTRESSDGKVLIFDDMV